MISSKSIFCSESGLVRMALYIAFCGIGGIAFRIWKVLKQLAHGRIQSAADIYKEKRKKLLDDNKFGSYYYYGSNMKLLYKDEEEK